jgi:DNA adenine methylase
MAELNPFLKWAGGKRWLLSRGVLPVSKKFNRYCEPFLGSAAIFFSMLPNRAILSDINKDLIHLYKIMRDHPKELYAQMLKHQNLHSKEYYYRIRSSLPNNEITRASNFLYLNRTCWNGLYRVNKRGEFNVPIGTKNSVIFDGEDFIKISTALKFANIICSDFEPVIDSCTADDFIFIDPPYTVQHNNNNFLKYNENIFRWDDQIRLRDSLVRAKSRGVSFIVTNADHCSIRSLYSGICTYQKMQRHSVLAGKSSCRNMTTEALFVSDSDR